MTPDRLINIMHVVNKQQPDLVALTGDFVTELPINRLLPDLTAALKLLNASTLAILGNHDCRTNAQAIRGVIKNSGLIDLNNAVYTIQRGDTALHFGGVDDIWEHRDRLDLVLKQLPVTGAAILLAHEPDFADVSSQTGRFDLQLSGHSHGGQVVIPFYGPVIRNEMAEKYPLGLYTVGEMLQYTNRGLGMVAPRVRFNCRPEITVFTLAARRVKKTISQDFDSMRLSS
jgi:predicted MPP superfamily phosphohydrolase